MSVWPEADHKLRERWLNLPRHPLVAHYALPPPKPRNPSHHAKRPHRRIRPLPAPGATTLPKLPSTPPVVAHVLSPPLLSGTCQFISGDVRSKAWSFCGGPSCAPGSPWCVKHKRMVFVSRPALRDIGEDG